MIEPLITIGITCYNADDSIERAVIGALNQDYKNVEIVIVDDQSQDRSREIVQALQQKYFPRIKFYVNEKNLGVAGTRNKVLELAKGEYLAFFDDDDDNRQERIRRQYYKLKQYEENVNQGYNLCFSSICKKYPNGYETHTKAIGSESPVPQGYDVVASNLFLLPPDVFYGGGTPSCSMMCKTSDLREIGGYDVNLRRMEDTDLAIRFGLRGAHFIGCKDELVIQYASSGADKSASIGYDSELYIVEKYKEILDQHKRYFYARDWVRVRYLHFSGQKQKAMLHALKMVLKYPLLTLGRFFKAAPRRLLHEWKMQRDGGQKV